MLDRENCIGCGLCAATCPDVFAMGDDGVANVICEDVPAEILPSAKKAESDCPVSVITLA
ncbi:MAG: ferredoxin [Oscillospiraceae bacterium]